MAKKHFYQSIAPAKNEEELKHRFANYFDIRNFDSTNYIDLYTAEILFEFKLNKNLQNPQSLAEAVAQTLYYARRLYTDDDPRPLSTYISVVTKDFGAYFVTETFSDFYKNDSYDWDLPPSSPSKILVEDLLKSKLITEADIFDFKDVSREIKFVNDIGNIRKKSSRGAKKIITPNNFDIIFEYWQSLFGDSVKNSHKPSEYFITDIEGDKTEIIDGQIVFHMTDGAKIAKPIDIDDYKKFWISYERIRNRDTIISIRQRMDRMTEDNLRRFTGEFYTPKLFADKAVDYINKTVGSWWLEDNFRLWDMAAGTGNLEFSLPEEALSKCYISTLIEDEANYCADNFQAATCFQFDFLNDAADKLPANLLADLANPDIKWLIFINPPYVTANNKNLVNRTINKDNVSMTAIRKLMTEENLGETSRELVMQFIYRISKIFANRTAYLGMFSKINCINARNDQKLRDKVFRYKFERGFVFSSQNFNGCKGKWPVGFLIWNLSENIPLEGQEISLEVWKKYKDDYLVRESLKILRPAKYENFLSNWIYRPPCKEKFPPFSGALNLADKNKDRRDRIADGFLASLAAKGNEFCNQDFTFILSAPYVSAGALSITAKNFEQAMVMHMVRRLPKATWLNDRDQFMRPIKDLPREFITDCVVWSLFAPSNQTVALRDVEYEDELYQVRNNFYPFLLSEVRSWEVGSVKIRRQLEAAENRFAALWLSEQKISPAAAQVLESGRELYRRFYKELPSLDVRRWKIDTWDAGWYQIRMALEARIDLTTLSEKLLPQIYELGFLRDEVKYFS